MYWIRPPDGATWQVAALGVPVDHIQEEMFDWNGPLAEVPYMVSPEEGDQQRSVAHELTPRPGLFRAGDALIEAEHFLLYGQVLCTDSLVRADVHCCLVTCVFAMASTALLFFLPSSQDHSVAMDFGAPQLHAVAAASSCPLVCSSVSSDPKSASAYA